MICSVCVCVCVCVCVWVCVCVRVDNVVERRRHLFGQQTAREELHGGIGGHAVTRMLRKAQTEVLDLLLACRGVQHPHQPSEVREGGERHPAQVLPPHGRVSPRRLVLWGARETGGGQPGSRGQRDGQTNEGDAAARLRR